MKANELRIGSIVKANVSGVEYCFIDEIRLHGDIKANYPSISGRNSISWKTHLMPEPVALTDEWLLKFGFEKQIFPYSGIYLKNNIPISSVRDQNNQKNYKLSLHAKIIGNIDVNLYYVHQLQNLFFDMTGEELTVEETA